MAMPYEGCFTLISRLGAQADADGDRVAGVQDLEAVGWGCEQPKGRGLKMVQRCKGSFLRLVSGVDC